MRTTTTAIACAALGGMLAWPSSSEAHWIQTACSRAHESGQAQKCDIIHDSTFPRTAAAYIEADFYLFGTTSGLELAFVNYCGQGPQWWACSSSVSTPVGYVGPVAVTMSNLANYRLSALHQYSYVTIENWAPSKIQFTGVQVRTGRTS